MKKNTCRFTRTLIILVIALIMIPATLPVSGSIVYAAEEDGWETVLQADPEETVPEESLQNEPSDMEDDGEPEQAEGGSAGEAGPVDMTGADLPDINSTEPADVTDTGMSEDNGTAPSDEVNEEQQAATGSDPSAVTENGQSGGDETVTPEQEETSAEEKPVVPVKPLKVTAKGYTGTYNGKYHMITLSGVPKGATVKYLQTNGKWSTTVPKRKDAGSTKVKYRVTSSDGQVAEGSATITIKRAGLKSAKLSSTSVAYTGTVRHPSATVYGKAVPAKLKSGKDYTITYSSGCKYVGKYTVTIKGKGNYTGTIKRTFTIKPGNVTLPTRKLEYQTLRLKTNKSAAACGGTSFQIVYRTGGGSWKYVTSPYMTKVQTVPYNKDYYVKVRAVKTVNGTTYYGAWSGEYRVVNNTSPAAARVLQACRTTGSAGRGYCAAWVCNVFDRSGVLKSARMWYASDYYRKYCTSTNRAALVPGMIVCSRLSSSGGYAGHIGIYIGNGQVIGCEGPIVVRSLESFRSIYSHGSPIKWGWMNNRRL